MRGSAYDLKVRVIEFLELSCTNSKETSKIPLMLEFYDHLISGTDLPSLLLSQSLRRSNIPFQISERDASFKFRGQGYRLRLSNEGLGATESVLTPQHSNAATLSVVRQTEGGSRFRCHHRRADG